MKTIVHNHSTLPGETAPSLADLLRAQAGAGCAVLTDGFYAERDPVWLAIECTSGVEPGPPADYYGAGFTVPTPVICDHLHHQASLAVQRWRAAQAETSFPVKAVLPGPLTLAQLAEVRNSVYEDVSALAEAWATALLPEFSGLVEAGAKWIQIDEPGILRQPTLLRLARDLLQPFWDSREDSFLIVSTWGPGAADWYAQLHSLPTDAVGVDLVANPELWDLIAEVGASQQLYLGLANPFGHVCGDPHVRVKVKQVLHNYEFPLLHIGPSCGLQGLSPEAALDTLRQIAEFAGDLSGKS
ncbi:MAG: methylcobamide--CoM methyltransferase [Candidatus Binatia bacterium]|nr:MAG: methylcobamide--CoM methyltransferase [Candidatus Binatia bacterium]